MFYTQTVTLYRMHYQENYYILFYLVAGVYYTIHIMLPQNVESVSVHVLLDYLVHIFTCT
jgi:hypothetical protein